MKEKKYKLCNSSIFAKTVCLKHPTESHSAAEGKRAILSEYNIMNKICTFILGSKTKLSNLKCFQFTLHFLNIYLLAKMHTAANRPKKTEWRLQCGASRRPPPPALTQVEFAGPLRGKGT